MEALKEELRSLVAKDRIKQVLDRMKALSPEQLGDVKDQVFQLSARFNDLNRQKNMGLLDFSDASTEKNKIVASLMAAINELGQVAEVETSIPAHAGTATAPATVAKRQILFLAANPTSTGRLKLDVELRDVGNALRDAGMRDSFELTHSPATRPMDLYDYFLREHPAIIHFSGHGELVNKEAPLQSGEEKVRSLLFGDNSDDDDQLDDYSGGIVLTDDQDQPFLVKATVLASLFEDMPKLQCVFLNACYSEAQAEAILEYVPYVIGMNTAVPDTTAIKFATGFYKALGEGKAIPEAFRWAKKYLTLHNLPGAHIPVLREHPQA